MQDLSPFKSLREQLRTLREDLLTATGPDSRVPDVHPTFRDSATNLLHYLALRRRDLRPLQTALASLGLSSLGRSEAHVLASIEAVLSLLDQLTDANSDRDTAVTPVADTPLDLAYGERLLAAHTDALLGPPPAGRAVRIMVTMPGTAADDPTLVSELLRLGMDGMRINCAHDTPEIWERLIDHLRRAERAQGRTCRVFMDLGGPKLRTGPLCPGPEVVRVRPQRDALGRTTAPARLWLTAASAPTAPPSPADACVPVEAAWLATLVEGDEISLTDARGGARVWFVVDCRREGCWVEALKGAFLVSGGSLSLECEHPSGVSAETVIGPFPATEAPLQLHVGDTLLVRRDQAPGRPATYDHAGRLLTPATIGCTLPEVFDDVVAGEAIWFDDGHVGGVVEHVSASVVTVRITHAPAKGYRLRADKGINLPDSHLRLSALTDKDREDLRFVAAHADVVQLSFANTAADVEALQALLAESGTTAPAIVLKVETRRAFEHLPSMLLAAMRSPCCGVMIARGDLAVECGFERLAEVQEEILWICEAAHVPVIWATQVLETLAKEGMPSRAEITDAAMGHRAECVMLNKGPHVTTAVRVLDDILRRMQAHQSKKRAMLRELQLAHRSV
jgi:pyruvate kinase